MLTTPTVDNTIHFQKYNSGRTAAHEWQENPYFLNLDKQRRKRSARFAREARQRRECREMQQTILQLLIDADRKLVHINDIAEQIGRSPQSTVRFLFTQADNLWIDKDGGRTWWVTSLQSLPDRHYSPFLIDFSTNANYP